MAVNAMRWIGTRIDIMEGLIQSGQVTPAGAIAPQGQAPVADVSAPRPEADQAVRTAR
jgi:hypothetical protein